MPLADRFHFMTSAFALAPADLPPPDFDGERAGDAAREILARPEFRQPPRTLYDRGREWVFDRIGEFLDALLAGNRGTLVAWLVLAAAVAVAIWFGTRIGRGVRRDPAVAAARRGPPRRTAAEWRAESEAHEARGEWRRAVRCRYRALVADLAARGILDEVPGRTAGEYRAEVTDALPASAPPFAEASDVFELAWYGDRPTGPEESARLRSLTDRVLSGAPS